jgi:hypothetical protein
MIILFLGDVFGKAGRKIVIAKLSELKDEFSVDLCIANGENLAQGRGMTEKTANAMFNAGVDVFTSGNHLWDRKESYEFIKNENRIVKPLNYPEQAIGNEYFVFDYDENCKVIIATLVGQAFMGAVNSPHQCLEKRLASFYELTKNIIIDFHAEATAEKRSFGFYFDGKVSAIIGTHTHIQTADEEVLPQGSAYITDVGMTGPHDSIIGVEKEDIFRKIKTGMPVRYTVASKGLQINAVVLDLDENSGKVRSIKRIKRKYDE